MAIFQDITERQRAAEIVARRAHELSLVAELGTKISSILEPSLMLQTVADLVKESFGLYQVLIYLMNERGDLLTLAVGSGETGRRLVAQGWQVSLGNEGTGQDAAAQAARLRQGVIFNDVRAASYTGGTLSLSKDDRNDLLPETRAEMAVPMIVGERVTGVVDIQAAEANRFSEEDVSIHTVLASQVAVALQNSRTYAQTQRQAEYEALINAITQKIQSTTTIENALQVAVRELGRALGVSRASVQLGVNRQKK